MNELQKIAEDYLTIRRSLGYKLSGYGRLLSNFFSSLEDTKSPFITTELALAWATHPRNVTTNTAARRLAVVRGFAEFARTLDPRTEVPPRDCLPSRKTRPLPYIYSDADIGALMQGAKTLRAPQFSRSMTSTLIGLLAVTGMRIGEAIALDHQDFDRCEGVLTIQAGKFGKSRELPLHATTQTALRAYEREREMAHSSPDSPAFFLSMKGRRLFRQNFSMTFTRVLRRAGLLERKPRRPRIHDLRHSFAVNTLCEWYRAGVDVEAGIPLLSTYLGHVGPSSTYWYLTGVPELLGLAAQRLERVLGGEK
jgi:integrase